MIRHMVLLLGGIFAASLPPVLSADPEPPVRKAPEPTAYRLARVERGDLTASVRLEGVLRPEQLAGLRSRTPGIIEKIFVQEGQLVKAGEVLVQIDPRAQEIGLDLARVQVLKGRGEVDLAEGQRKLAEANYDRQRRLYETKAVGEQEVQAARVALTVAQSRIEEARANLQLAELHLRKAQLDLDGTRLLAPFSGVVQEISGTVGELTGTTGNRLILLASSPEVLVFRALIEARQASDLRPAMPLKVNGELARIDRIVPVLRDQEETPRLAVEARLANAQQKFVPFQAATAQVTLGKREGVLMVPKAALTWRPLPEEVEPGLREAFREVKYQGAAGPALVLVFGATGLRPVRVEVLAASEDRVAIQGALKEGDTIVLGRAGLE